MDKINAINNDKRFRVVESGKVSVCRVFETCILEAAQFANIFGSDRQKLTRREALTA